jgi:hypothetical protein
LNPYFHGSSLELSHLYINSAADFQQVLDAGGRKLKAISAEKELLLAQKDTLSDPNEDLDRQIHALEYDMDLSRLLDYYTHYFMHYYRWIDQGDRSSAVSYKLAMGQFWATEDYHRNKYGGDKGPEGIDFDQLHHSTRVTEQTDRAVRWAKVLVVILLFLLVMGIPRFIRDRGYRKFAATLYFDALFRPHKVSDMNAWHSVNRMAAILVLLYLFGAVILSSFSSWLIPLVLGSLGLLPVIIILILANNKKSSATILISLMAPKILIMLSVLAVMAVRGPMFFWYHIWISNVFRALFLAIFMMLVFHKYHVHIILARKWSHRNHRGSAAMVGMAAGVQGTVVSLMFLGFGSEATLLALNRELFLLPERGPEGQSLFECLGLSADFPWWLLIFSGIVLIISFLIFLFNRKPLTQTSRSGLA